MPGSITLPQVVLELEEEDRQRYEALEAPKSIVCRYGYMRMVAELPYDGEAKPGCGSKLVVRTRRGIELAEMLTTTCANNGCGKSVSRKQMLQYIDNSGGRDYPFSTDGKVLRVATMDDLTEQQRLDAQKPDMIRFTKGLVQEMRLPMKLVDIELLLGGERIIFHYTSDDWVDFRELVRHLASQYQTRIEMHQVNARDEARLVADYEKCGQHCCCKQFLKVLKPVSMRSAKVQKATLDPTKISGRCGRLMCCLRYEDETYESLRKKLPHRQTRVKTDDGEGVVIDGQILTQLVLVILDTDPGKPRAYPLEHIEVLGKDGGKRPRDEDVAVEAAPREKTRPQQAPPRRPKPGQPLADDEVASLMEDQPVIAAKAPELEAAPEAEEAAELAEAQGGQPEPAAPAPAADAAADGDAATAPGGGARRRRRRRRRGGRGRAGPQGGGPAPGNNG